MLDRRTITIIVVAAILALAIIYLLRTVRSLENNVQQLNRELEYQINKEDLQDVMAAYLKQNPNYMTEIVAAVLPPPQHYQLYTPLSCQPHSATVEELFPAQEIVTARTPSPTTSESRPLSATPSEASTIIVETSNHASEEERDIENVDTSVYEGEEVEIENFSELDIVKEGKDKLPKYLRFKRENPESDSEK